MKKITTAILSFFISAESNFLSAQNPQIDSLKGVLQIQKEDTSKVNTLLVIARRESNIAEYEEAREHADQALALSEKIGFKIGVANAYSQIGLLYFYKADFFEALNYYQKSLTINEQEGNKPGMASILQGMGLTYQNLADYPKALEYSEKALKMFEASENIKASAGPLHNIGMIYYFLGNDTVALTYYLKAQKINTEYDNKRWLCRNYEAIGNIYLARHNYTEALTNYNASLKIAEETGDKLMINSEIANIGIVYKEAGRFDEALKNYFTALKFFEESGDSAGMALSNFDIAEIFQKKGNIKDALLYQIKGLSFAKASGAIDLIKLSYERLAEIDSSLNNYKGAYENHKLYMQYNDSLFNMEKDKKLTQLQMQYEFDKKEAATKAEQDKKDLLANAEISRHKVIRNFSVAGVFAILSFGGFMFYNFRKQKKLESQQALSNERLRISRELHDDIGSTLGSIAVYSDVAKSRSVKNENPVEVLSKIGTASRELIEKMSDIVWSLNPDNETFEQLQNRMQGFAAMILTPRNIIIDFKTDDALKTVQLTSEQRRNIFLIYKEAVHNIVKYAECKNVLIAFSKSNNCLSLLIKDDGKGFENPPLRGEQVGAYNGNGIKNMNARTVDINASLNITSKINEGTNIELSLQI